MLTFCVEVLRKRLDEGCPQAALRRSVGDIELLIPLFGRDKLQSAARRQRERVTIASAEIKARLDLLERELDQEIQRAHTRAAADYWIAVFLMVLTISSSFIAGIGGISKWLGSEVVGVLALIPGAIALLVSYLKYQGKSSYHYRKAHKLKALKSKLRLQLSEEPTADQIAAIARDRDQLLIAMNNEWDEKFSLTWTAFEAKKDG